MIARATLLPPAPTHAGPRSHAGDPLERAVRAAHRAADALLSLAELRRCAIEVAVASDPRLAGVHEGRIAEAQAHAVGGLLLLGAALDGLPRDAVRPAMRPAAWIELVGRAFEGPEHDEAIADLFRTWAEEQERSTLPDAPEVM